MLLSAATYTLIQTVAINLSQIKKASQSLAFAGIAFLCTLSIVHPSRSTIFSWLVLTPQ